MKRIRNWLAWHSIQAHIVAPIWLRVPEKQRWRIVGLLNRSKRWCWADLVSDAQGYPESDPCDVHVPSLRGDRARECASVCGFMHTDHTGQHACSCYCGKFQFTASDGALERMPRRSANLATSPAPVPDGDAAGGAR